MSNYCHFWIQNSPETVVHWKHWSSDASVLLYIWLRYLNMTKGYRLEEKDCFGLCLQFHISAWISICVTFRPTQTPSCGVSTTPFKEKIQQKFKLWFPSFSCWSAFVPYVYNINSASASIHQPQILAIVTNQSQCIFLSLSTVLSD